MERITYDDFAKLDIRLGKILSVEIVEGADKLLRFQVDVGEVDEEGNVKSRQILSAIRTYFEDPRILIGKTFPFLINLEPRMIRGFESQGMILAGSVDDTLVLITPDDAAPPGTKIG